jgi:multiple sugar transport system ATP-binding protein
MGSLELRSVVVERDGRRLLDRVDLDVAPGERLAMVGPSGAGKTTLLRAIAGLERLTSGSVLIDGEDVTDAPPARRDLVLVAQDGPLLPHLDVEHNLRLPLEFRRFPASEIDRRTVAEGRAFAIRRLFPRRPRELSAGEQHSVALARSLVRRGRVLLLDEPLARLDAPRRVILAREVVAVQSGYGVTTIIATNDQRTAFSLGERIAVIRDGRLLQVGSAQELYDTPVDSFVARFVGEPPMSILSGRIVASREGVTGSEVAVTAVTRRTRALTGRHVLIGVRPTALHLAGPAVGGCTFAGTVSRSVFLGYAVEIAVDTAAGELVALVPRPGPAVGSHVDLSVDRRDLHVFDRDTGRALAHGV